MGILLHLRLQLFRYHSNGFVWMLQLGIDVRYGIRIRECSTKDAHGDNRRQTLPQTHLLVRRTCVVEAVVS